MTAAKHTPGPWVVNDLYAETEIRGPQNSGAMICVMSPWGIAADEPSPQRANARLIAAAPELLEALEWREQFEPRAGEGANEQFERIAENFRRETGHLRPGKDCWVESHEVRQQAWDEWMEAGRARVRAAIAKATGSAQ